MNKINLIQDNNNYNENLNESFIFNTISCIRLNKIYYYMRSSDLVKFVLGSDHLKINILLFNQNEHIRFEVGYKDLEEFIFQLGD